MRSAIVIILIFLSFGSALAQMSPDEIRHELVFESFDKQQIMSFHEKMEQLQNPEPLILAYQGVSEALMAKVRWDPFRKLSHLSDAREMLDEAIERDANNIEIRFLRFSLEYHVPSILRINEHLVEDKQVMLTNLRLLDQFELNDDMVQYILEFLTETQMITAEEFSVIQNRFNRT